MTLNHRSSLDDRLINLNHAALTLSFHSPDCEIGRRVFELVDELMQQQHSSLQIAFALMLADGDMIDDDADFADNICGLFDRTVVVVNG